jgi:hypothetical protein
MKAAVAKNLHVVPAAPVATSVSPSSLGTSLTPTFEIQLRRRHDETAPIETVRVPARTIASARHAARLGHPDTVILAVKKL